MMEVPRILWQTYKSVDQLPVESLPCIDSWLRLNRGWSYHFCSDRDMETFFQSYLEGRYLELFRAMPLPVMKADLWRYAILEAFGGFYADIDTYCSAPLDDWLDHRIALHLACEENHTFFCQWAFGAAPHHPMLHTLLRLIQRRVEEDGGVDETIPHYVHHYTGPSVWTDAMRLHMGVEGQACDLEQDRKLQSLKQIRVYPAGYFGGAKIHHLNGSITWKNVLGYDSWQRQRKDTPYLSSLWTRC